MPKTYLGVDYSVAKSGMCVMEVKNRKPVIKLAYLITSDKSKALHQRIDETVTEIKFLAEQNNITDIVREEGFVGNSATAIPIAKAHAIFEYQLMYKFNLDIVYNTSIKAFAKKIIGKERGKQLKLEEPRKHSKLVVKEAVEKYYGKVPELYTPRGAYIDDIGDSILLLTLWLEQKDLIDIQHRFEEK